MPRGDVGEIEAALKRIIEEVRGIETLYAYCTPLSDKKRKALLSLVNDASRPLNIFRHRLKT